MAVSPPKARTTLCGSVASGLLGSGIPDVMIFANGRSSASLRFSKEKGEGGEPGGYVCAMTTRQIDREWLEAAIRDSHGTLGAFGDAAGLKQPKVTNILKGTRRVQIHEAQTIARLLGKRYADVVAALGDALEASVKQKLDGYVGASGDVVIFDHGSDDYGLDEVEMRVGHFAGLLLQIRGDSMAPRYFDGEVIGIHADPNLHVPPENLLGQEGVANAADGRVVLKILQAGQSPGRFSLVSINPRVLPIVDVELVWAREIELRLPARVKRTLFRSS